MLLCSSNGNEMSNYREIYDILCSVDKTELIQIMDELFDIIRILFLIKNMRPPSHTLNKKHRKNLIYRIYQSLNNVYSKSDYDTQSTYLEHIMKINLYTLENISSVKKDIVYKKMLLKIKKNFPNVSLFM